MQITIDGHPLAASATTFAQGLNAAVQHARDSGRLVMRVIADGRQVEDQWIAEPAGVTAQIRRLECESVAARELVAGAFKEAAGVLGDTRAAQLAAAEHLQLGDSELAFEQLHPVLAGWAAVQQTVTSSAALLQVDVSSLGTNNGVHLAEMIAELGRHISGLKAAISVQDWSSAADTLAYDLDGACERWGDAMRRLSGAMSSH